MSRKSLQLEHDFGDTPRHGAGAFPSVSCVGRLPTMSTSAAPSPTFAELLSAQVRNEFTASQQYIAIAIWFDAHDLPRLAGHFYRQSVEERNHAIDRKSTRLNSSHLGISCA